MNAIVEEVIIVFLSASVYACLLLDAKLMEAGIFLRNKLCACVDVDDCYDLDLEQDKQLSKPRSFDRS